VVGFIDGLKVVGVKVVDGFMVVGNDVGLTDWVIIGFKVVVLAVGEDVVGVTEGMKVVGFRVVEDIVGLVVGLATGEEDVDLTLGNAVVGLKVGFVRGDTVVGLATGGIVGEGWRWQDRRHRLSDEPHTADGLQHPLVEQPY